MATSSGGVKFRVYVKVRGGQPLPYYPQQHAVVGDLLKEVYHAVDLKGAARLDTLMLYQSENACLTKEQALKPGMLVSNIDGGKDDDHPLFVDYPDEPSAKRQRAASQEEVQVEKFNLTWEADHAKFLDALAVKQPFSDDRFDRPAPLAESYYFDHLLERKDAFVDLLQKWYQNFVMAGDRAKAPLVALPSAPGTGKTRFVWVAACRGRVGSATGEPEWERAMEELLDLPGADTFKEAITGAVAVTVTFNFGKEPQSEEKHAHMIGVRMLHSHFARNMNFCGFLAWLRDHGCSAVTPIDALKMIRKDVDEKFGREPRRHIILVVDEPLATIDSETGVAVRRRQLSELCSSVGVIATQCPDVHMLMTSLSGPELRQAVTPASRRPIDYVEHFDTLSRESVGVLVAMQSLTLQRLLTDQRFEAVLRECLGVPRLIECTVSAGLKFDLKDGSSTESIRLAVSGTFHGPSKYVISQYRDDALIAALSPFRHHTTERQERTNVAEREGYLFGGKIPPLVLTWWSKFEQGSVSESAVLLCSVNNFVSLSGVRDAASHGKPFERQLAHSWRILSVTDAIWRSEQPGERKPRTILGMLGKHSIAICGTAVRDDADLTASYNLGLAEVGTNVLIRPFVELEMAPGQPTDVPADLRVGTTYFPQDQQNPGFDFAVVDQLDTGKFLLTLVEAKYSGEDVKTRLSTNEIANKFVLALKGRPRVHQAFVERRLCYVIGGLRRVQDVVRDKKEEVVGAIVDELKKGLPFLPRIKADLVQLVARSLVVLDRPHVETLLTPTLAFLPPFSDNADED